MAEIARITIGVDGDTKAFKDIEAAGVQASESIQKSNVELLSTFEKLISTYEILEKVLSNITFNISQNGDAISTFTDKAKKDAEDATKKYNELIIKQPLPIPIIPPPQEFLENPGQLTLETLEEYDRLLKENKSNLDTIADVLHTIVRLYEELLPVQGALQLIAASIATAFAAVLLALGAMTAGQFLILVTALAGAFFIMSGGIEQVGKVSEFVFKQLNSALMLTEEEAQKVGDRLREAVENQPDTFPDLPPVELELKLSPVFENAEDILPPELLKELEDAEVITPELDKKIIDAVQKNQQLTSEFKNGKEAVVEYVDEIAILEGAVAMAGAGLVAGAGAQSAFAIVTGNTAEQLGKQVKQVENIDSSLQNLTSQNAEVVNSEEQVMKAVDDASASMEGAQGATKEFAEETQQASVVLDGLAVFASDVAANINDSFADLIFNSMKGNFDTLGDLWDNALDSMLQSLSQFIATVISNPIRLSLEAFLGGGSGGGGGFFDFGGLGGSFGSLGSLFGIGGGGAINPSLDLLNPTGFGLASGTGILDTLGGIGGAGFLSTLGSAIPAIGAIAAVLGAAIPIISNLFEKTPRLDLDFDQFRDDFGKSTGEAAKVLDFLDEELFENEIFSRSVSRKAGLGLGDQLPDVIREAIEGQITAIQDIINQLPFEVATQLNEALLNTAVDIESTVKGDRLLEFDETKKIAEKFQQFIEGDLQARFIFSIREFFVGAFESLGVLSDSAQSFVDEQFEEFQNLSGREAKVISLEEVRKEKSKNIECIKQEYKLAA